MFKFQNEQIFFCIDKICFYINKICTLPIMFTVYSNLLIAFMKYFFSLSKIVHCFLIKIVHSFLHKLFLAFCIKLFSVQHYLKNYSLSFLRKLFSVHYLKKIVPCFLIKHLVKSCFLILKAKYECFFMFKFQNEQICFSALIKSISILIKFALCTLCLLYIRIYLLHS